MLSSQNKKINPATGSGFSTLENYQSFALTDSLKIQLIKIIKA
jgi:hypothetical protein